MIEQTFPNSSRVKSAKYIKKSKKLYINFVRGEQYVYTDVPEGLVKRFMETATNGESPGVFFDKNIRSKYNYAAVEGTNLA